MIQFRSPDGVPDERLRLHAAIALRFPRVVRALAAFAYGVSPHVEMLVDVEALHFRLGIRASCAVPLSRLITTCSPDAFGNHLTHAFAAHSWAHSSSCTISDLLDDSTAVFETAGVGRSVKSAISFGGFAKVETLREAADRIDVLLLLLAGEVVSGEFGFAKTTLSWVSATGDDTRGMTGWVKEIMARIDWNIDADLATSVLRSTFPPVVGVAAHERFAARNCLAQALS